MAKRNSVFPQNNAEQHTLTYLLQTAFAGCVAVRIEARNSLLFIDKGLWESIHEASLCDPDEFVAVRTKASLTGVKFVEFSSVIDAFKYHLWNSYHDHLQIES